MTEREIFDGVIVSGSSDFALVVESLRRHGAGWCVIGGMAVNSYTTPVYTADLDLVVTSDLTAVLEDLRAADFRIREFPYSVNAQRRLTGTQREDSALLVQFSKAVELQPFVDRAILRPILGIDVPVAALPDLVAAKIEAWSEPRRRPNKRRKDELDLLRLAEEHPEVVDALLPATLLRQAQLDREQIAEHPEGDGWGGES